MPGRLARNGWPEWIGMGGRLASESVADFKRNMHETIASHGFPDSMAHKPSGFKGDTQGSVKLIGRDSLL